MKPLETKKGKVFLTRNLRFDSYRITKLVNLVKIQIGEAHYGVGDLINENEAHELNQRLDIELTII